MGVGGLLSFQINTNYMEENIDDLLKQAQESRGRAVIQRHVDLVKATGEHKKLGGEVDYNASLSAIVDAYGPTGVMYSLVREVLHDTEKLNAAVADLVDAKEITKGNGKRDFLLTTTKKTADQPAAPEPSGEDDAESDDEPPTTSAAKVPKPKNK